MRQQIYGVKKQRKRPATSSAYDFVTRPAEVPVHSGGQRSCNACSCPVPGLCTGGVDRNSDSGTSGRFHSLCSFVIAVAEALNADPALWGNCLPDPRPGPAIDFAGCPTSYAGFRPRPLHHRGRRWFPSKLFLIPARLGAHLSRLLLWRSPSRSAGCQ